MELSNSTFIMVSSLLPFESSYSSQMNTNKYVLIGCLHAEQSSMLAPTLEPDPMKAEYTARERHKCTVN